MTAQNSAAGQGAQAPLLEVRDLSTYFPVYGGALSTVKGYVHAVDDVSFTVNQHETLGLVGESGCGKSTLIRSILLLEKPTKGQILFEGQDMQAMKAAQLRHLRRNLQIVFQDPYAALDPRMTIGQIIGEPLRVHGEADAAQRLVAMLPQEMRPAFVALLEESDPEVLVLVKAADKLSAHIKCVEELKAGNAEFRRAAEQTRAALDAMGLPELDYFMEHCAESFSMTLDELE